MVYSVLFLIVFLLAFTFTPIVRKIALDNNIVDKCDGNKLKIHERPVALLGGLAILAVIALGVFLAYSADRAAYGLGLNKTVPLISASAAVFGLGLWDDIRGVKPIVRFFLHILAGVIVLLMGIRVNFIPLLWAAIPLTLFYIAGAVNAFNVIDGMDGLCVGLSLVSCVGFFFIGFRVENMLLMVLSGLLFMSLLGFLPYNFYHAKIFLGDAGSGFLGFMLGTMAVMATSKQYDINNFIAAILVIGVPVIDMAFAILRRLIRRKPLFIGDRDHLYDLLLKRGWSQPKVWGVMCGIQSVLVGVALVLT